MVHIGFVSTSTCFLGGYPVYDIYFSSSAGPRGFVGMGDMSFCDGMSVRFGFSSNPKPGASDTSREPPCGTGSFVKSEPKTGRMLLPSGEFAISGE